MKYAKPSDETYKASKLGLEIFLTGALSYARNWWKSTNALPIKNAAGLSKKRKAGTVQSRAECAARLARCERGY